MVLCQAILFSASAASKNLSTEGRHKAMLYVYAKHDADRSTGSCISFRGRCPPISPHFAFSGIHGRAHMCPKDFGKG